MASIEDLLSTVSLDDLATLATIKSAGMDLGTGKRDVDLNDPLVYTTVEVEPAPIPEAAQLATRGKGLNKYDVLRYSVGYAESGPYSGMIIIPSFGEDGKLNYFTSRAFYDSEFKHKNPSVSKDIIGYDLLINWNEPIVLVEGAFDAIAVGDNAIPIFGKMINNSLKKKIVEKGVKDLYIVLDQDARVKALQHAKYFMDNGINVYFVDLPDKDPSELGKEKIRTLIKNTNKMTFGKLMEYKLYAD